MDKCDGMQTTDPDVALVSTLHPHRQHLVPWYAYVPRLVMTAVVASGLVFLRICAPFSLFRALGIWASNVEMAMECES